MRKIVALVILLVLATGVGGWWVKFEHAPPVASLDTHGGLAGPRASWDLVVHAPGLPGLRRVEVRLLSGGPARQVFVREYESQSWIGSGVSDDRILVPVDFAALGIGEGTARLEVVLATYAWKFMAAREVVTSEQAIEIDLTAPSVQLISMQHNVRLGGSSVAVFRVGADTTEANIEVADYVFPATLGYFADPAVAVAIFAVPQDLSADASPKIRVSDKVGNERTVGLPCRIRDRVFPERTMNITDPFLERKVPELLAANGIQPQPDLVQGYLVINRKLRQRTEHLLRRTTHKSHPSPLWDGAFRRLPNAATMSGFADRRIYSYNGEVIDQQTHLGYDLASTLGATVEAAQNGIVVSAGTLGIYGETVVLDHGLGVFSLYGHLRTISVQKDQRVAAGDPIGQTGETGLAGGDHLHYSVMLYGTQVDPLEWWDGHWIQDNVTLKLNLLPAASATEPVQVEKGST